MAKGENMDNTKTGGRRMPVAADYLGGQSPNARAAEKRRKCVSWLYRWGYSTSSILARVVGTQGSVTKQLLKAGLVVATRTEAGGIIKGTPVFYYTLSDLGVQEAEYLAERLLRYPELERYRVNQRQMRHDLIAQTATIDALSLGTICDYRTDRQLDDNGGRAGFKRPDVVWFLPSGAQIAIEVELSAKWDRQLDEFLGRTISSMTPAGDQPARFERVAIVTDSPAIGRRYQLAMKPSAPYGVWTRDQHSRWHVSETRRVPDWLRERVDFRLMDNIC